MICTSMYVLIGQAVGVALANKLALTNAWLNDYDSTGSINIYEYHQDKG